MKSILTTVLVLAAVVIFALPGKSFAANDTLVVYANSTKTLDQIISADVTGGAQAHKVYKLVSRDTTYIFDNAITVTSDIAIVGVLGSNGRPPCIQPDVLADKTVPATLLILNANNIKATLQNLYITGQSIAGSVNSPNAVGILVKGDRDKLICNNVVFEQWDQFAIEYTGAYDGFNITNCKFRNMCNSAGQWYVGEAIRNLGGNPTDTLIMKYNTFFCINGYASCPVTGKICTYFDFSHNSVIYTFKNPFFIFNVTNAKINDNLFYNAWSGGISKTEYPWWDQLRSPEVGSLIDLDTLNVDIAKVFDPTDSTKTNVRMLAEAKRTVEVKNNAYFWAKRITDYTKAWNDTAHVDTVITVNWMNQRTTKMFTDKTTWPGFTQSGNQNVDPGFGASIDKVLDPNTGSGVGFFNFFKAVRTGIASSEVWGYQLQTVTPNKNWIPAWPLPEATDMKYSSAALKTGGTDGKPVGDPYWFNGLTAVKDIQAKVPASFQLFEAYPNPFNPSTTIKFNLPENGNVTLRIYNLQGQLVQTVVENSFKEKGSYEYRVNMNSMASGIYLYTLQQNGNVQTKKMALIK